MACPCDYCRLNGEKGCPRTEAEDEVTDLQEDEITDLQKELHRAHKEIQLLEKQISELT